MIDRYAGVPLNLGAGDAPRTTLGFCGPLGQFKATGRMTSAPPANIVHVLQGALSAFAGSEGLREGAFLAVDVCEDANTDRRGRGRTPERQLTDRRQESTS